MQPKDVEFSYSGGKAEFIIAIDAPNLNSLGDVYQKNQSKFDSSTIINIDRHIINNNYGAVNYVVKNSSSTSELIMQILLVLKTEIDKTMATNLYNGIASATNMFTSFSTNSDTFLALSHLLKIGAVKKMNVPSANSFGSNPFQSRSPFNMNQFQQPSFKQANPLPQVEKENFNDVLNDESEIDDEDFNNQSESPQDSLKPKIFSNNGGLV
jgi:hypothetical protein